MPHTWLVTGSNRGIGRAVVDLLLKDPDNTVIATTRKPESLQKLAQQVNITDKAPRLHIIQLDVQKSDDALNAVDVLTPLLPGGIDYFISNAGVDWQPMAAFDDLDLNLFLEEIKFYTTDVIRLVKPFLPLILKSKEKKIVFMTSLLSSMKLTSKWTTLSFPYSVGKAALNMLVLKWGYDLAPKGVLMALVHPGWVKTEMGDSVKEYVDKYSPNLPQITGEESAEGVIKISREFKSASMDGVYNYDGQIMPW